MPVTIAEVAKKAGVSVVTVSRVLNGTYRSKVSDATRARVLQVARELSYRPSPIARGLRKGRTMLIGIVLPSLSRSFTAETIQGIQDVAEGEDFSTLLYTTGGDRDKIEKFVRLLWEKRVDGLLYYDPHDGYSPVLDEVLEDGIPVVQVLADHDGLQAPFACVDHRKGGALATAYLLGLGHRHILHLSAAGTDRHGVLRQQAFYDEMKETPDARPESVEAGYDWKRAYRAVLKRFQGSKPTPTAIFAASDVTALGAMKALAELGLRAPDDVSIVGFDNMQVAELSTPGLTTVAQPGYDIGRRAMEMTLAMINGEEVPSLTLEPQLIVRESAAPL